MTLLESLERAANAVPGLETPESPDVWTEIDGLWWGVGLQGVRRESPTPRITPGEQAELDALPARLQVLVAERNSLEPDVDPTEHDAALLAHAQRHDELRDRATHFDDCDTSVVRWLSVRTGNPALRQGALLLAHIVGDEPSPSTVAQLEAHAEVLAALAKRLGA